MWLILACCSPYWPYSLWLSLVSPPAHCQTVPGGSGWQRTGESWDPRDTVWKSVVWSVTVADPLGLASFVFLGRSHCVGETLEEAKKINASLTALGKVIDALVERRTHVPWAGPSQKWLSYSDDRCDLLKLCFMIVYYISLKCNIIRIYMILCVLYTMSLCSVAM